MTQLDCQQGIRIRRYSHPIFKGDRQSCHGISISASNLKGEIAIDVGGVTKDMFSVFFSEVYLYLFDGYCIQLCMLL